MHLAGIAGHPRRIADYVALYTRLHYAESLGALGIIFSWLIFGVMAFMNYIVLSTRLSWPIS